MNAVPASSLGVLTGRPFQPAEAGETTGIHARNSLTLERAFGCGGVPNEVDRVRLIGELTRLLREPEVPESMRAAGLTLIGWLARRMPGEDAHALGVPCSERAPKKRR